MAGLLSAQPAQPRARQGRLKVTPHLSAPRLWSAAAAAGNQIPEDQSESVECTATARHTEGDGYFKIINIFLGLFAVF